MALAGKIRIGFIVGKDNDAVEDPQYVGDASFLSDLPATYRTDPVSGDYGCPKAKGGMAHADTAIPWWIHKNHGDRCQIDIIRGDKDLTLARLKKNDVNFIIGYDQINTMFEGDWAARKELVGTALRECGNIWPTWEVQEFIYYKSRYMQACLEAGVPMAPTIFCFQGKRTPEKLLAEARRRGWQGFCLKLSFSAFSLGFLITSVEACTKDPTILKNYFAENGDYPEFICQELITGFKDHWETRCFHWGYDFQYAICNKAAVVSESGAEIISAGRSDQPKQPREFVTAARAVAAQALKILPKMYNAHGAEIAPVLNRVDIGCSTGAIHDKGYSWKEGEKTFFLNEMEYGGTNYFVRHLPFDCVPLWGEKYFQKAVEIMTRRPPRGTAKVGGKQAAPATAPAKAPAKARGVVKKQVVQKRVVKKQVVKKPAGKTVTRKPAVRKATKKAVVRKVTKQAGMRKATKKVGTKKAAKGKAKAAGKRK
mmetsp:Transcript_2228/g.4934  ORF Transcript_2228/g.4934 Transcript_2228/m.4934 type:complete len:482 (-) Transcript_2228:141-1586(-)|eukprot:CAMPEP_0204274504 /NCGR_PEP_ID=MMETSP0468-20130131/25224_1 /ASSEMBLY_ACC=CAM_ASM_000383 /TAXON_ID=2969 /ORGANISM="Oxyrrhis marina" /LENGTH=481 /DNA_ID=CAMNT_0051250721 /DNA_START=39 /DNA_END=1484 /DNA_ORIENTATION=-